MEVACVYIYIVSNNIQELLSLLYIIASLPTFPRSRPRPRSRSRPRCRSLSWWTTAGERGAMLRCLIVCPACHACHAEQRTTTLAMREGASNKYLSHCTTIDNQYKTCIMCIHNQFTVHRIGDIHHVRNTATPGSLPRFTPTVTRLPSAPKAHRAVHMQ